MTKEKDIEFYKTIEGLKKVTRYKPIPQLHENVACHAYMTIFLAYDIMQTYDMNLDKGKVIDLLLIHDLPELGMEFDIPATEIAESEKVKFDKKQLESAKVKDLSERFDRGYIKVLFEEFEHKNSNEAKFANFIDKFESAVNVVTNRCAGFKTNDDFEFIIKRAEAHLNDFPQLKPLVFSVQEQIKKLHSEFRQSSIK